jgi:hypothetical protein
VAYPIFFFLIHEKFDGTHNPWVAFGYLDLDLDLDFKSIDLKCLDFKSIDFKISYLDLFIQGRI